jgi:hypothetical protein
MNVRLPDGRIVENVPEGTTKSQIVEKLRSSGVNVPEEWVKEAATSELKNPQTGMRAALDATASVASGAVAAPVSGLAGIAGAVLPGPQGQGADWQQRTQQALTHQPSTVGSEAIVNTASAPFNAIANQAEKAGGAVTDVAGPVAGTAVDTAIQALPMVVGKGLSRVRPSVEAVITRRARASVEAASRDSVKAETWALARKEGYVAPPSEVSGGSFWGSRVESVGGKAALRQQAEIRNQQVTNKISRKEAGLGPNEPIDDATLSAARERIAAPYREVEALPGLPPPRFTTQLNPMRNPYPLIGETPKTPKELVHDWKSVSNEANELWKDYQRNAKVETLDAYRDAIKRKESIETDIEKAAVAAGRPDLVPALKAAKVKLAKNFAVDRAANDGNGSVDLLRFGKMLDKDVPLTGGLLTMGRFAKAFGRFGREESKVPAPGISKVEAMASVLSGAGGAAAAGPWGMMAAAVPIAAPPIARSLALSRLMQPSTGLKPYSPGLGLRAGLNLTDQGITDPAALIIMSEEKRKGLGL